MTRENGVAGTFLSLAFRFFGGGARVSVFAACTFGTAVLFISTGSVTTGSALGIEVGAAPMSDWDALTVGDGGDGTGVSGRGGGGGGRMTFSDCMTGGSVATGSGGGGTFTDCTTTFSVPGEGDRACGGDATTVGFICGAAGTGDADATSTVDFATLGTDGFTTVATGGITGVGGGGGCSGFDSCCSGSGGGRGGGGGGKAVKGAGADAAAGLGGRWFISCWVNSAAAPLTCCPRF